MRKYAAVLSAVLIGGAALLGSSVRAQQSGTIRITAPGANASVNGPVTLSVDIQGVTVKPAAEGDPAAFHYHALVDVDPATVIQPGQPLPTGQANIIHTADRNLALPNLSPGQHTVVVILTRTDHVPLNPNVQDRVTFTVAGAAAAPAAPPAAAPAPQTPAASPSAPVAAPRVGAGGALLRDNELSLPLLLTLAMAAAALSAGGCVLGRRRR